MMNAGMEVDERGPDMNAINTSELVPKKNANTSLVIFGGIANGIDIPPFEFRRMTDTLQANKVFVRDTSQSWYQGRLQDPFAALSSEDSATVLEWLNSTRTVFMGNSMGGFAAILFGTLFAADHVLAFSPQTFISPFLRLRHLDHRWSGQILRMYARHGLANTSYNLRTVLSKTPIRRRIDIYHGERDRNDTIHAAHLSDLQGVTVTAVPEAGHGAVKKLRERGELSQILYDACKPEIAQESKFK